MNNNQEEYISLAKMIMYYLGDKNISPSEQDKDFACNSLKRISERRQDWTEQQRELYKLLVDLGREQLRNS